MLWKLSFTGIKSRFKDYLVLFSGLAFASAIFYMFMTLAMNPAFLKGSLVVAWQTTKFVFGVGIVLLSLITFVYIIYANSFLLNMRQKDYGMYMMLGAKPSKIGRLIFLETLLVGVIATLIGNLLGIGLAQLVSKLLISQLGLQIHKFVGFYLPALLWTLIFFVILFFLAALWNRRKLVKSNVINLLHENQKPVKIRHNPVWKTIEAILGVALLATGYWAMAAYKVLLTNSVLIAFVTIVLGSYFVFDSLFTGLINLLRKNTKFKYARLNSFTLGQLKFRLTDYTRILSIVSLLFALALGAITVGLNFNNLADQALDQSYYDVVLFRKNSNVEKQLKKVDVRQQQTFDYKTTGKYLYVSADQIDQKKIKSQQFYLKNGQQAYRTVTLNSHEIIKHDSSQYNQSQYNQLQWLLPTQGELKLVSQRKFDQVQVKKNTVTLLLVNDFRKNFNNIEKLQNAATPKTPAYEMAYQGTKSIGYRMVSVVASGFEFMGFFLGIAFLTMLASTLMFKVLSGANSDKPRYNMLWKVGTRRSVLKKSIAKEIGVLFALPSILGIVDVLFGLQFFKAFLTNPYDKIWIPFTIFLVLYVMYYLITVKLYEGIVLKKQN